MNKNNVAEAEVEFDVGENVETEVVVGEEVTPEKPVQASEDQFEKADSSTQKRINRLTKKMREAERREAEALNYAKQIQAESAQLKSRIDSLDSHYVTEYSNRVTTQTEQAEAALAHAMEVGDTKKAVEAQKVLTQLTIQNDRAQQAKLQQDRYRQQAEAQAAQQVTQPMPQQAPEPKRPDPKSEQWAVKNDWFGSDEAMTYAAFGVHKKLVEDEGFDPQTDDYYNELDRRMEIEFPHKFNKQKTRPVQAVASANRTTTGRSGKRQVRLSPSQVAIAKKLGVPLEEYAKYVKE
jgi:hypothetical protein